MESMPLMPADEDGLSPSYLAAVKPIQRCPNGEEVDQIFEELPLYWETPNTRLFVCSLTSEEREQMLYNIDDYYDLIWSSSQDEFDQLMETLDNDIQRVMSGNGESGEHFYQYYFNLFMKAFWYECIVNGTLEDCVGL